MPERRRVTVPAFSPGVLIGGGMAGVLGAIFDARDSLDVEAIPAGHPLWHCDMGFHDFRLLPVFDWAMYPRVEMIAVMWFFLHRIYGAFTGMFTPGLRDRRVVEESAPGE